MAQVTSAPQSPDVRTARSHALGDLPRRSARRSPTKVALRDGDTVLTYAEFDAVIDRTAAAMADAGLTRGDALALLSHNCWQYVVLNFAAARLGVVLVPINFMLGPSEVAFILEHSEAAGLVVEDALAPVADAALAELGAGAARLRQRLVIPMAGGRPAGWTDVAAWTTFDGTPPQVHVDDDDPVRLMYTSGTESRPKGALLSSRSLLWQYASCVVDGGFEADDVELHALPLYHCAQLDVFLGPNILLGGTNLLLPAPDPATVLRTIAEHRVTKFFAPPTVWIGLLRHPDFDATDLSSLRKGYYGASPMPVEVLKEIQARLPDVRLWNLYGQTEMSPLATVLGPEEQLGYPGSAGRAGLCVETRIVAADGSDDTALPAGEIGEIVHRSPHATLGYFKDPAKTAEAFRDGWFHSGDLGYVDDDGRLYVVDRKKDMIKTGGENVASREVEEAVYSHPGVAEVAVFGVPHPHWVEAVAAVVVAKEGATLTPDSVIEHCRTVLAGYKTPKYVVVADALPKNPSGKILKRDLRDQHADLGTT
ncbi:acyl-CoA synthetase [Nocardioides sp.]|uniref:acyl-CoA synthetase n=1 Tax=Nocardioides sp. TaxID=35761 RepID=UPI003515EEA9